MKKVSVIVPVYNAIEYLDRSINSITNQTYKNLEIILINDHSADDSKKICEEYARKDNRIVVLDTVGKGVSATRNTGIISANGEYLCFLDSDDEYENEFVEKMVSCIENYNTELVVCGYKKVHNNQIEEVKDSIASTEIVDYLNAYSKQHGFEHLANYPWNKLYITEVIKKNEIFFDEKISVSEDAVFNMEYIKYINQVQVISDTLVKHYIVENSLVSKKVDKEIQKYTILKIYNEYKNNYLIRNIVDENDGILGQYLLYSFLRLCEIYDFKELKSIVREMQSKEFRKIAVKGQCININYKIFKTLYCLKFNWMLRVFSIIKRR